MACDWALPALRSRRRRRRRRRLCVHVRRRRARALRGRRRDGARRRRRRARRRWRGGAEGAMLVAARARLAAGIARDRGEGGPHPRGVRARAVHGAEASGCCASRRKRAIGPRRAVERSRWRRRGSMSRAEVQDVAAARLLPLLRECALAIAPAAADAEYAPTQRGGDRRRRDDRRLGGGARRRMVALDSEWVPGMRGLALLSSRRRHRLLASVLPPRHGVSTLDPPAPSAPPRPGGAQGGQGAAGGLGAIRADGRARRREDVGVGRRLARGDRPAVPPHGRVGRRARAPFLGRRFALKGSVDHKSWGTWPLGDAQRLYAAADACVVADLVVSIAEKEAPGVDSDRFGVTPAGHVQRPKAAVLCWPADRPALHIPAVGRVLRPSHIFRPRNEAGLQRHLQDGLGAAGSAGPVILVRRALSFGYFQRSSIKEMLTFDARTLATSVAPSERKSVKSRASSATCTARPPA